MLGNARALKVAISHGGRGRRHALAVMCGAILVIAVVCGGSGIAAAQGADAPPGLAPDAEALLRHTSDVRSVSQRGPITFEQYGVDWLQPAMRGGTVYSIAIPSPV